jgi:hypothetical protein
MPPVVGVIASSLSDSFSVPVLTAGAVAAACWIVAAVLVGLARRPPRIRAAEQTMELPPESPAVAGLLVNDFVVPAEIAPAILIDLAARRVVALDEVQPGRTICRLRPRSETEDLRTYGRRGLESLQKKAIDGVVPTEALTTGPETESKSWHRALVSEVVDEAQSSGLTHDRWPKLMIGALSTLLGIAIVLGAISIKDESSTPPDEVPVTFFVVLGVAACFIALASYATARMGRSQAQLPTDAGRAETAVCEGLAHHLRDDRPLADLPPAAVALRGRHFAYAAAFGFAPLAVELLPMGKEDDRRAWSRFGGRWRRVRVRYPRFWPPAWGRNPGLTAFLGALVIAVCLLIIRGLAAIADTDPPAGTSQIDWRWVERGALLAMIPFALVIVWHGIALLRAVPDLWSSRTITGDILRERKFEAGSTNDTPKYRRFIAVDDGTGDQLAAFRIRSPHLFEGHAQGDRVTVVVSPRLGYVRSITQVSAPG